MEYSKKASNCKLLLLDGYYTSVLRKNAIISSNIEDWFTILDNTDGRGFADRMKAYYDKIETI